MHIKIESKENQQLVKIADFNERDNYICFIYLFLQLFPDQ